MATELRQKQRWCKTCGRKTLHVATIKKQDLGCGFFAGHLFLSVVTFGIWIPIALLSLGLGIFGNSVSRARYLCQVCGRKN